MFSIKKSKLISIHDQLFYEFGFGVFTDFFRCSVLFDVPVFHNYDTGSEKSGKTYDATVVLEDTGQYVNFKLDFDRQKGGGK